MELIYMWVEDYKNIKNQGFNFSPNHNIIGLSGDDIKYTKIEKKQPKNIFGENISNITAIIGKNGSGKSTLLKAIIKILTNSISSFDNLTERLLSYALYYNEIGKMQEVYLDKYNEKVNFIYYDNFNKNTIDMFQYKGMGFDEKNHDISNFFLSEKNGSFYYSEEIKKQIIFLSSIEIKKLKNKDWIKFPQKLKIFQNESETTKTLKKLIVNNFRNSQEFNMNRKFLKLLFLSEVLSADDTSNSEEKNKYFNEINELYIQWEKLFKLWIDEIKKDKSKKRSASDEINEQIKKKIKEKINIWILEFEKLIKEKDREKYYKISPLIDESIVIIDNDSLYLEIELNDSSLKEIKELIEYSKENKMNLFTYSWEGLSTGEESLLSMYSRFYYVKNKINLGNCLIIMDEPDNYLHPEWQRNLIKTFVDFINIVFEDKDIKFQIVLTSHSPFVASDLPRENVIMLDVYDENEGEQKIGNCKVVKDNRIKTFGANIFDLYSNAFFVESSFGEFAKSKIKEVVKDLTPDDSGNFKEIDKTRILEIEYLLDSLGEPLVKNKLQKMYDDYKNHKGSTHYKKEQLKELKKKIGMSKEDIKKLLENGDLDD